MKNRKAKFIEFLIAQHALQFGEFKLKSGRTSPYFFNLGVFNSGASLKTLGEFYAQTLIDSGFDYDVLFGPAYKGIPLVATTAIALFDQHQQDAPYCFNRKAQKNYGDGGQLVGAALTGNVVMLDDVITAGTTVRATIELMQNYDAHLSGIVIAFDREERGEGELSAVQEVQTQHHIPVASILSLTDVIHYLEHQPERVDALDKIKTYQSTYGVNTNA